MAISPQPADFLFEVSRRGRVPRLLLFAYLVALVQPCAMAMGSEQHSQGCHQDSVPAEAAGCLSQPALDCTTDELIVDSHDLWKQQFDAPLAASLPNDAARAAMNVVAESAYFSRAPPLVDPPLNIRHCVYLK